MTDQEWCEAEITLGEEFISMEFSCQLPKGHDGPHKYTAENPEQKAILTWEDA